MLQAENQQLHEGVVALSTPQTKRKTELGHDVTCHTAKFLDGRDLAALLGTSRTGESAVKALGPSQPYLQKCSVPIPSDLPRFTEGCKDLMENVMGLFSAVIVMAKNFNDDNVKGVINMVQFDIQDHTDPHNPETIFEDKIDSVQGFMWIRVERKFTLVKRPLRRHGAEAAATYFSNEKELVQAIKKH